MTTSPLPRQWEVWGQDSPVADVIVSGSTVCTSFGLRGSLNTSNAAQCDHNVSQWCRQSAAGRLATCVQAQVLSSRCCEPHSQSWSRAHQQVDHAGHIWEDHQVAQSTHRRSGLRRSPAGRAGCACRRRRRGTSCRRSSLRSASILRQLRAGREHSHDKALRQTRRYGAARPRHTALASVL